MRDENTNRFFEKRSSSNSIELSDMAGKRDRGVGRHMHVDGIVDWVAGRLATWQVPGASVAIINGSKELAFGMGYHNISGYREIDEHTLFPLASSVKSAAAVLAESTLQEAGLTWDTPLVRCVPELGKSSASQLKTITFEDAFSHRTGLASFDLLCCSGAVASRQELTEDRLRHLPALLPARQRFHYSNAAFLAANYAIERAVGRSWDRMFSDFAENRLGLEDIKYDNDELAACDNVASPHGLSADGEVRALKASSPLSPVAAPSGAAWCSAADMLKLMRLHLSGEGARETLVTGAQLENLRTGRIAVSNRQRICTDGMTGLSYALGWVTAHYRGERVLAHAGNTGGLNVWTVLLPAREFGVAVFFNSYSEHAQDPGGHCFRCCVAFGILDRLLSPYRKWGDECEPPIQAIHEDGNVGQEISVADGGMPRPGAYHNAAFGEIRFEEFPNKRVQMRYGNLRFELKPGTPGVFWGIPEDLPEAAPVEIRTESSTNRLLVALEPLADFFVFTRSARS